MSAFGHIDRLTDALSFHRARHAVLSGNIANVDTPGYRPFDLERSDAAAGATLAPTKTHAAHLGGPTGPNAVAVYDDSSALVGGDGNAVNLERELAKLDANRVRYGAVSEIVTRQLAMLRYAAGAGQG